MIKQLKHKKKSFTLIEIVVSLVIMGIGLTAVTVTFFGGRFILKQAENKSRAISVATVKMEEHLAKTFSGLGGLEKPVLVDIGTDAGSEDKIPVDWKVSISTQWETNSKLGIKVPYKVIEVNTFYNEKSPNNQVTRKNVKLVNIVPYPYMHTESLHFEPETSGQSVPSGHFEAINSLSLSFNYPVAKDIMLIYNIAISIDDSTNIKSTDTIYTACRLDGEHNFRGTQTRTPISMQPFISNVVPIDNVSADKNHTLSIEWMKETDIPNAGIVRLKEANLMILSAERQ